MRFNEDMSKIPATPDINLLRIEAHGIFDQIWKNGFMTRKEAYLWLADVMNLLPHQTHFRKMNHKQLREAIHLTRKELRRLRKEKG